MKYLVVRCEELWDGEGDALRTPLRIVNDWEKWANSQEIEFRFEVYKILEDGAIGEIIKSYEDCYEEGMALLRYDENGDPFSDDEYEILAKFKGRSRKNKVPTDIATFLSNCEEFDNSLSSCGYISGYKDGKFYVYGEYYDGRYEFGY